MKRLKKFFNLTKSMPRESGLWAGVEELLELRRKTTYLRALSSKMTYSSQSGEVKSAFKGRGVEMEEIRAYVPGDDVRDIDWRVTARKSNPYTKLYAEEKDREIYALLDLSPHMAFGTRNELKSVAAAKIAVLLGWLSLENKDRFGAVIFNGQENFLYKPQNRRPGMLTLVRKISDVTREILQRDFVQKTSFSKALQLLEMTIKNRATVFVVSDFADFDEETQKKLAVLAKKADVYVVNVFDVLEENAPKAGEYMVADGKKTLVFDSGSKSFVTEYKKYFAAKRLKVKDFCAKFGCRYMEVRTDIELYRQIKII